MRIIKSVTYIALGLAFLFNSAFASTIEADAEIHEDVPQQVVPILAAVIQQKGYSCNSISAVTPYAFSIGYSVICDHWIHAYDIEEKGGRWTIKPN